MRKVAWIVAGMIVTAGLGYASYWVYLEVQQQIRGTLISGFGIFAGVMGASPCSAWHRSCSLKPSACSASAPRPRPTAAHDTMTSDRTPRAACAAAEGMGR